MVHTLNLWIRQRPKLRVRLTVTIGMFFLMAAVHSAHAQRRSRLPTRQIPDSVLLELRELEHRFDQALALDCALERCFPKGCRYLNHGVIDQPRRTSLPGLGQDEGPGSIPPQEFLTAAECAFAYENTVERKAIRILSTRLKAKLSGGFLAVSIDSVPIAPNPPALLDDSDLDAPEEIPEPEPVVAPEDFRWNQEQAIRDLWDNLLPHFPWMIAIVLLTLTALIVIWGARRLGKASLEEQAFLARLGTPTDLESPTDLPASTDELDGGPTTPPFDLHSARLKWQNRFEGADGHGRLGLIVRDLLRNDQRRILAKAMMMFPDHIPLAFPDEPSFASSKLAFSDYFKNVSTDDLPNDEDFFDQLERVALTSLLLEQGDTNAARTLREDIGATGLKDLIEDIPAQYAALIFAHITGSRQHEVARLLSDACIQSLGEALLRTNRISGADSKLIYEAVESFHKQETIPSLPTHNQFSDTGKYFDAVRAMSILAGRMSKAQRELLFERGIANRGGTAPDWYREFIFADMLLELPAETRTNLLLSVDIDNLSAWLSLEPSAQRDTLVSEAPITLQAALQTAMSFENVEDQLRLAEEGRKSVAEQFQAELKRRNRSSESALSGNQSP